MVGGFAVALRRVAMPRPSAADVAVAVVCFLATVALPLRLVRDGGWLLLGLAVLVSVPLLWRRRWPVVVAAVVGAGTLGLAATGVLGSSPLPYAQLVATYTVALLAGPVWRVVVLAATAAGLLVAVLVLLHQSAAMLGLAGLPFVVAYGLGVGGRARQDRIRLLEERGHRLAEAQEATAALERARISREIHDIVAHSVSLMVVQAEAGIVRAAGQDRTTRTFETIADTGREALGQLDRALGVLRGDGPGRAPEPGLGDLPVLVDRARQAGLVAELSESGDPRPVPADLAAAVYRVVQEAVTNTVRHAAAVRVRIHVAWRRDAIEVSVQDDGRGPASAGAGGGSGRGLIGMRERVHAFGGELRTGPGPDGAGFRVAVTLPTDDQAEQR
jgi:signal transduction histidine kinase